MRCGPILFHSVLMLWWQNMVDSCFQAALVALTVVLSARSPSVHRYLQSASLVCIPE